MFGFLMVMSFCEFNFIMKHFKFLKTVLGKGVFSLFVASMFLVGNAKQIWGWIMFGGLAACGLFFILVSCACIKSYEDKDLKKDDVGVLNKKETKETDPATEHLV